MLIVLAFLPLQLGADTTGFAQQFRRARTDYFQGLSGDRSAETRAGQEFQSLERERPQDPVVMAYGGSLELLDAAHTWAVWNKHRLASEGLTRLDEAAQLAPQNLEVRFIHAATTYHLPFFYHRKAQAESEFAYIAPRAEQAAATGALPAPLAAAALDYYGQILQDHSNEQGARRAFQTAARIAPSSPGGQDASRHLQ